MKVVAVTTLIFASALWSAAAQSPPAGGSPTVPAAQAPVITGVPPSAGSDSTVALPADRLVTQQLEGDLLAGDLIGRPLFDGSGHHIGEVSDILIDRNRRLSAVVVTLNAGAGSKKIGIPFDALRQDPGNRRDHRLIAQVDTAALRQAKAFEALAKEASQDDNQDLTTGRGGATGASVPPPAR